MNEKQYNHLEAGLAIIAIIQILTMVFVIPLYSKSSIQINNVFYSSLNETLQIIEKNCGTPYITHRFGSNDWFVFKSVCVENGFCKYDYVPLEECLKP